MERHAKFDSTLLFSADAFVNILLICKRNWRHWGGYYLYSVEFKARIYDHHVLWQKFSI